MKLLERENLVLLPIAAVGLVKGLGEVFVRPFFEEKIQQPAKVARAAIHFYRTGEPHEISER